MPFSRRKPFCLPLAVAGALIATALAAPAAAEDAAAAAPDPGQEFVKDGVSIRFSLSTEGNTGSIPLQGEHVEARFAVRDVTSGRPVRGLSPGAWVDVASGSDPVEKQCREKFELYAKGLVGIRPMIDLNSYHLLVLNNDPSISVIDPFVGMTGRTSLYTTILLKKPGADWVRSADSGRVYVAMPLAKQVAIVDATTFKVLGHVDAGSNPTRVALQPDGRYLWVGNDARSPAESGVTVIDTQAMQRVAHIRTGRGHHEIAFTADGRRAVVTNRTEGTVSIVDVARLRKTQDVAIGPVPISVATSSLSGATYVADGRTGVVTRVDPERGVVTGRVAAQPGLGPMRFSPDGRWGVVVNTAEHAVHVIDAASGALVNTIPVGGAPYQVTFTRAFAYVRLIDSAQMALVHLDSLGEGKNPAVQTIAIGAGAPKQVAGLSVSDSITPAATEQAVFALNPAESTTYFYMEGMNAPSGSFSGYGHQARAVLVTDRSVRELEPGVYGARLHLPAAGTFLFAVMLDTPRVVHCFVAEAKQNPFMKPDPRVIVATLEDSDRPALAGTTVPLRVRIAEPSTGAPRRGLSDVQVVYYGAPGTMKSRVLAREVGDGVYEADITPKVPGAYYVYVAVPSLGVNPGDLPFRTVIVRAAPAAHVQEQAHAQ